MFSHNFSQKAWVIGQRKPPSEPKPARLNEREGARAIESDELHVLNII
jgi:hypothetical protein